MRNTSSRVDYSKFTWSKRNTKEFRHLKLLLYWPLFGLLFMYAEHCYPVSEYHLMYCAFDDRIPFLEVFVIPYVFWFAFIIGMLLYTLLYDVEAFRKMMWFFIITYTTTIIIYFLFPTYQDLRPTTFERSNLLTQFVTSIYGFDTNTNVCPSMHVIGSLAVMFTALHCKELQKKRWKISFVVIATLICLSTVFLKQHSIIDVIAALPISLIAYYLCFYKNDDGKQL